MKNLIFWLFTLGMGVMAFGQTKYGYKWSLQAGVGAVITAHSNLDPDREPDILYNGYPIKPANWAIKHRISYGLQAQRMFALSSQKIFFSVSIGITQVPVESKTIFKDTKNGHLTTTIYHNNMLVPNVAVGGLAIVPSSAALKPFIAAGMGAGLDISHTQFVYQPYLEIGGQQHLRKGRGMQYSFKYLQTVWPKEIDVYTRIGCVSANVSYLFGEMSAPHRNRWWGGPGWK